MAISNPSSSSSDDDYTGLAEINIVPLVDIMLVLLIIFMVAAPLSITGIKINLPQSPAKGTNIEEKRIILSINENGMFFVGAQQISTADLQARVYSLFEHQKDKVLYIRADRSVKYGRVIDAMGAAKLAGVSKISMLTEPINTKK